MKTAEEILKKHLDGWWKAQIGHHPHIEDVLAAMEEYAQQQVKNLNIPDVSNSEAVVCEHDFSEVMKLSTGNWKCCYKCSKWVKAN